MPEFLGTLKSPRLSAAPSTPVGGQMYYNTASNTLLWYNGTTWTAAMDAGGAGALPADVVVIATTRIIANKLAGGDTQPAFRLMGDGKHEWGVGGTTAPDISISRTAAGVLSVIGTGAITNLRFEGSSFPRISWYANAGPTDLRKWQMYVDHGTGALRIGQINDLENVQNSSWIFTPDGSFVIQTGAGADAAGLQILEPNLSSAKWPFAIKCLTEGWSRFAMNQVGTLLWGGGAGNFDINLYRYQAGDLRTDSNFEAGGIVTSNGWRCRAGQNGAISNTFHIWWDGAAHLYIDATYIGAFAYTSDERHKHKIQPIQSTWEKVKALNPVSFRWRDKDPFMDDGKDHIGFIAQELQEVIPSGVTTPPEGEVGMSLSLPDIIATLTKALQEAMLRIEALEAK
jgi:hypothetical protein